jgi:hypothetical protein
MLVIASKVDGWVGVLFTAALGHVTAWTLSLFFFSALVARLRSSCIFCAHLKIPLAALVA